MNRTTPFKGLKMLFAKCQYTSTLVRVTHKTESQGDISKDGLGFVLMQQDQPVTFANRALTLEEQKY